MDKWFESEFAKEVATKKYFNGMTPAMFYEALSNLVADDKDQFQKFFDMQYAKRFCPGGRILHFAGRPEAKISFMNCTTSAIEGDDLDSIAETARIIMQASSHGQGIGIDISKLRPKGSPVNNAAKTSTGSISFMEMLNNVGGTIGQEGRRAALLFSIQDCHPDLWRKGMKDVECPTCQGKGCFKCKGLGYLPYDFLHVKRVPGHMENANISVMLSDAFMQAVEADGDWEMSFTYESAGTKQKICRSVKAKELLRELAYCAYTSAEPGVLFWDSSKRLSNSDLLGFPIAGVNACSEATLDQQGLCNLGSLNLGRYIKNPFTKEAWFSVPKLTRDVRNAVDFLDNIVTLELLKGHPISEQQRTSLQELRRLGLGIMGFADALAMLGIKYGYNDPTLGFIDTVFSTIRDAAYTRSIELAKEKGPCGAWEKTTPELRQVLVNRGFLQTLPKAIKDGIVKYGMRNITLISLAPTGSISNLLGASSGIEPLFAREYVRRVRISGEDELLTYVHPVVTQSRAAGVSDDIWVTAYEVSPEDHVLVEGYIQRYVDQSISKTVNLPVSATVDDVENVFMLAWKNGLKGVSIYVDQSRAEQVLYESAGAKDACPECGGKLVRENGCTHCAACSWSKCG